MRPGAFGTLALLAALAAATALAAPVQLWSVNENDLVVSWVWPDLDGDGIAELIMEDGVGSWFYDGAADYEQVWYVEDPAPAADTIFGLWLQRGGWYVFRQQNTTDQEVRLHVYQAGAAAATWSTVLLEGNATVGGIGDFDGDGQLELAWSWHSWDGEAWTSSWTVRTLASGAVELAEQIGAGYLSGPWPGNVEGDESEELLLNWYWTSGTAQLVCWGASPTAIAPRDLPATPALAAWPNPFNPLCHLRLEFAGQRPDCVTIHNLAGQELRRIPLAGQGAVELVWDGLDNRGRPAASGAYVVRAGGQSLPILLQR